MKKLIVIGKGTAGTQALIHFMRWRPNWEIEWHYDPAIAPQAVGEGSTLDLPRNMFRNIGFTYNTLVEVADGSFKTGILKEGWGSTGKEFFHPFPPPTVSMHFNAVALQNYIHNYVKDKIKIVEGHVNNLDDLDADHILDCSGKPKSYEDYNINPYIPVNAVHVNQCYWDYPRFHYTLTIARPYGWVFGIPLQNRCSIGYLYNSKINTLDEVKKDILNVIDQFNLKPSNVTNSFEFGNYTRKKNFHERVAYNGNASFFLEPLEATSFTTMNFITRSAFDIWNGNLGEKTANMQYDMFTRQVQDVIMMHYFAGSKYKTEFWEFAQQRGRDCMNQIKHDTAFQFMINTVNQIKYPPEYNYCLEEYWDSVNYGPWPIGSFAYNIRGLGIQNDLNKIFSVPSEEEQQYAD